MLHVTRSVTINRPRDEVYQFWRDFTNLPRFMYHLDAVTPAPDGRRSHWVAKGPAGTAVEWEAEITDDRRGEAIVWQSLPGSDVPNRGTVSFTDAPGDRGTEVRVDLGYDPPGGSAMAILARWMGADPATQVRDDLRRFKQVIETGEVVLSEGSLEGAGEGLLKERPAQAPASEVRS